MQILAEETVLARKIDNVIFGSVLLPMGEGVDKMEDDEFHSDSSEDDEVTIIKDRFGHKTKSDYERRKQAPEGHKTEVFKGSFRTTRR